MSKITKKQHFVPRFYLKRFTNADNMFYAYDYKNGKILPKPVYYETQCYKDYFYGEDGKLEKQLSKKEAHWAATISNIISSDKVTPEQCKILKEFVLYQRQRTSAENDHIIMEREFSYIESAKALCKGHGWTFSPEVMEVCKKKARQGASPAEYLSMSLDMKEYIEDLEVLIIKFETQQQLLTSDSPVVAINPFTEVNGFGYGVMGIVFLMPLSKKHLLMVYDSTLFSKFKKSSFITSDNEDDVHSINLYQMINADRFAYADDKAVLIEDEVEVVEKREKEKKRNEPIALGDETHRLIPFVALGVRNFYELSFVALPREYRKIPFSCREAIPRIYDPRWEDKLKHKYEILSIPRKLEKSYIGISKSELRIGCRKMQTMAKVYWQKYAREHPSEKD